MKKVNILGVEYSILTYSDKDFPKEGYDGLCDLLKKEILLREKDDANVAKQILRHEIIHGFFHESGLASYGADETLVDWIAVQFPKLQKAFEQGEKIISKGSKS